MAGKPKNFQAISNVLANYNFVDIASGTGYINFYAGNTVDLKILSNYTYYSDLVAISGTTTAGAGYELILDLDYDTVLNRPLDVGGLGIVNIPIYSNSAVSSIYADVFVRKWNGVTETDLVNNTSRIWSSINHTMLAVDVNIPLTHFKKGETLRLTCRLYAGKLPAATYSVSFGNDPKNRSTGWDGTGAVPSQLMFQCPVRLNL